MHRPLYVLAEFFSRPWGLYVLLTAALICAAVASAPLGTYIVSISALGLTGVVLIQNARDTAAMQAKLNEIIIALEAARNEVVGLEHKSPEHINEELENIETHAAAAGVSASRPASR
ncbi:low affinity iron permease family protein [Mesorhizobium sp. WSM4884]|uniref:low affinity iron permease family protein n=1 Tax=Mesorhizobium sp. WSM4884 TaxID=3038542 RepID=UPI00241611CE|nr:low affinity iron permease family protein [Mesorhizobium sp. WSM4884]MDG4882982.1 low affinity iron permease family protein [Mesorhizobium sp. WSM4884]